MLDFITWTADPAIFSIGSREIRWYGLAFAIGFLIGYKIVEKMWKREKLNPAWIDSLLIYTMLGTVIGARLGHCLFYAPDYYLANPLEILKVWEGGLASHGGTLGIIIAIYFYSKRVSHRSMLWTFDKLVVPTGLVAAMIRLGNLMNHEIYGHPTDLPWGFRFIENLHPFIIDERHKQFYYRGLREFASTPGYLLDTCLLAQDIYVVWVKYFYSGLFD